MANPHLIMTFSLFDLRLDLESDHSPKPLEIGVQGLDLCGV